MSVQIKGKKRKSGDDVVAKTTKKVKTVKSAEPAAPLKSALKKSKSIAPAPDVAPRKASKPSKVAVKTSSKTKTKPSGKIVKATVQESLIPSEADDGSDDDDEATAPLSADQTAALIAGFSSDESDSDADDHEASGIPLSSLPSAPTQSLVLPSATADPETTPGVLYLSRLPHGFYEAQLRAYFSQFGEITQLRLARNRRTGKPRHHAFVEFASAAVADIVAKTMDAYLLFGHILQARRIPQDQVKDNMWLQSKTPGRVAPRNKMEAGVLRRGMTREGWEKRVKKEGERRKGKEEKLRELGYEFEMPELKGVEDVPVKVKEIEGEATEEVVETTTTKVVLTKPEETVVVEKKVTTKRKAGDADTRAKGKKKAAKVVKK